MSREPPFAAVAESSRALPLALAVVCVAPFIGLLSPRELIVSDAVRDYASLHLPLCDFAREELLAGRLPLWNPYVGCGQPLLAAQQASLCYPLSTPLIVAFGANHGLKLSLFAHLLICFAGVYLLARRLAISPAASGFAAIAMTWSGALMGHLAEGHVGIIFQSALAPWFFLALMNLFASPGPAAAAQLSVIGSLCALADHPQILYYTFVGGVLMALGSLGIGEAARERPAVLRWGATAGAIVALTAAVQLLPAVELLRDGLRESGRGSGEFGTTYALDGADSGRLLMPYLNGTPLARVPQFDSNDHYHERVIYAGLAAPLLALYGLSRAGAARWQWAAAWSVVLALGVAFGDNTPVFSILGRIFPGLLFFRCPGRVFCVASLPVALLAARGLDSLARGEPPAHRAGWGRFAAVFLAGASIVAYAALFHRPSFDSQGYAEYLRSRLADDLLLWAMLAIDLAAIGAFSMACWLRGWMVLLPTIGVALLDLGYFNVRNFRMETRESTHATTVPPTDALSRSVDAPNFPRIIYDGLRYCRWVRVTVLQRRLSVATYDGGVLPAATARLYRAIEADSAQALALAACAYIWSANSGTYETLPGALPRLRFVPAADAAVVDSDIAGMRQPEPTDPREGASGMIRVVEDIPMRMALDVDVPTEGRLVLADIFYPGWTARIDGQTVAINRAHGVFRSVALERGSHRVVFAYEPTSFRTGVAASAVGFGFWCALVAISRRSPKSRASE